MSTLRRFLSGALLLLSLAALAGCTAYFGAPPPVETRGGFNVLVDVPGQPTDARAVADIETFARQRGFVRQSGTPGSERYLLGKITLDITYQPAHLRVNAYLHSFSFQLSQKFIDAFYRDFHQQYAGQYGDEDVIVQTDETDESAGPAHGGAGKSHGGGGGGQSSTR